MLSFNGSTLAIGGEVFGFDRQRFTAVLPHLFLGCEHDLGGRRSLRSPGASKSGFAAYYPHCPLLEADQANRSPRPVPLRRPHRARPSFSGGWIPLGSTRSRPSRRRS